MKIESIKKIMEDRVTYNQKIIDTLEKVLKEHPYLRFTQLLYILKLNEDRFYEEPEQTYNTIIELIKKHYDS